MTVLRGVLERGAGRTGRWLRFLGDEQGLAEHAVGDRESGRRYAPPRSKAPEFAPVRTSASGGETAEAARGAGRALSGPGQPARWQEVVWCLVVGECRFLRVVLVCAERRMTTPRAARSDQSMDRPP